MRRVTQFRDQNFEVGFGNWILRKFYEHRKVDGLVLVGDKQELDRVCSALTLIQEYDPMRYRRIVGDLKRIWVRVLPGGLGSFSRGTWTCNLERRYILDEATTAELIASVIVHEATHARLHRVGISHEERLRSRIESACFRQELAFARRLPDGADVIDCVQRTINHYNYSDDAMVARDMEGGYAALLHLGFPSWLARAVAVTGGWLRHRRLKRQKARSA